VYARLTLAASLLVLGVVGSAQADPPSANTPASSSPTALGPKEVIWLPRPKGVGFIYPEKAQRARIPGEAAVDCIVDANGALTQCRVLWERPRNLGFGEAAVQLYSHFRMQPLTRDGRPTVGAHIEMPLRFQMAK
jgi:TonB family protein